MGGQCHLGCAGKSCFPAPEEFLRLLLALLALHMRQQLFPLLGHTHSSDREYAPAVQVGRFQLTKMLSESTMEIARTVDGFAHFAVIISLRTLCRHFFRPILSPPLSGGVTHAFSCSGIDFALLWWRLLRWRCCLTLLLLLHCPAAILAPCRGTEGSELGLGRRPAPSPLPSIRLMSAIASVTSPSWWPNATRAASRRDLSVLSLGMVGVDRDVTSQS